MRQSRQPHTRLVPDGVRRFREEAREKDRQAALAAKGRAAQEDGRTEAIHPVIPAVAVPGPRQAVGRR